MRRSDVLRMIDEGAETSHDIAALTGETPQNVARVLYALWCENKLTRIGARYRGDPVRFRIKPGFNLGEYWKGDFRPCSTD